MQKEIKKCNCLKCLKSFNYSNDDLIDYGINCPYCGYYLKSCDLNNNNNDFKTIRDFIEDFLILLSKN